MTPALRRLRQEGHRDLQHSAARPELRGARHTAPHLADGAEVPQQVCGAERQLLAVDGHVLLRLLAQLPEASGLAEFQEGDAGLGVQLQLPGQRRVTPRKPAPPLNLKCNTARPI